MSEDKISIGGIYLEKSLGHRRIDFVSDVYLPGEELGASEDKLPVGDFFPSPSHSPCIKSKPIKSTKYFVI